MVLLYMLPPAMIGMGVSWEGAAKNTNQYRLIEILMFFSGITKSGKVEIII